MQYYQETTNPFGGGGVTKYVRTLLLVNCSVYVLQLLADIFTEFPYFEYIFGATVGGVRNGMLWQPFTYMFLHGSPIHLLMNMIGLYMFGSEVEHVMGSRKFLRLYLIWGIIAGLGWILIASLKGTPVPCVGASGAILGLLGCYAGLYPERQISLLFPPITLSARTFVLGLVVFSLFMMMDSMHGGVAHSAHLFGCLAGYIYGLRIYKNPGLLDAELYRKAGRSGWFAQVFSEARAKIRRSTFSVETHEEAPPTQEEIDIILDKLHSNGMSSLTVRERQALRRASEKKK